MFNNKITVANDFQTSVNIAYDLNNDKKISSFIPTLSSLDVIEDVLLSVAPNSSDRSRILIGAYGRGKSHMILVLLSLLYKKKNNSIFSSLLEKMKEVNENLYNYTVTYLNSDKKILPIVISGSSNSLTQSFLLALKQALNDNGLNDIMPDTHFQAAINAIELWKRDYPETFNKFSRELDDSIDDFIIALKSFDVNAYEKFVELYPKFTSGSSFNPFIGFDVVELYEKTVDKLCKIGYSGVYIVYDEFSKYLESSISSATISDIKLLQDFAEKCVRSKNKQMHLMLVCHKDISNYIDNNLPKEKVDGWRGVSGRFKHVMVQNNFSQMYEIISAVIKKEDNFWKKYKKEHQVRFNELEEYYLDNGLFDKNNKSEIDLVVYGCYPLHPISTFILPILSEKVAQNERTLFTFLSSNDSHTLSSFLNNKDSAFSMITPDYLYDYFEPLFRKEPYNSEIFKIYSLTAKILQKVSDDKLSSRIIKFISLIYIIEQFEKLPPIYDIIVSALQSDTITVKQISTALENLKNKQCIVYLNYSNNYLKLKQSSGVDIPAEIEKQINIDNVSVSVDDILNETIFENYMYPTRYNDENDVVRYFDFRFIKGDEFLSIDNFKSKLDSTMADGIVYAIIPDNAKEIKSIQNKIVQEQNNERIVFCVPKKMKKIKEVAYKYRAVNELKNSVLDDDVLCDEYNIYIEDLEEVILNYISSYTKPEFGEVNYFYKGKKQRIYRKAHLSGLLSDICNETYLHYPIINNESINKNSLPTVAINSRMKLLKGLLASPLEENLGLSGTGQDVSIMRSTLLQTGILNINNKSEPVLNLTTNNDSVDYVLNIIRNFFVNAAIDGEQPLDRLYAMLTNPKYGIGLKRGVIPIFIAVIINFYHDNIIIKKGTNEQKMSAQLLNDINENPESYSIVFENWNDEKSQYMLKLENIFENNINSSEKAYNNFSYIVLAMQRWYMSLPKYSKEMKSIYIGNKKFNDVSISDKKFVNSLKQLNINPREYLFEKLFSMYGYDLFNIEIINKIKKVKEEYDNAIVSLIHMLICDIKKIFSSKKSNENESLTSIIKDWYSSLNPSTIQHLFAQNENHVLETMRCISNDEVSFVRSLAKSVTSLYIEDWNEKIILDFLDDLSLFRTTIEKYNSSSNETNTADVYKLVTTTTDGKEIVKTFSKSEYSARAKLLFNEITNSIDEMGESISEQEKRQILIEILEKLC